MTKRSEETHRTGMRTPLCQKQAHLREVLLPQMPVDALNVGEDAFPIRCLHAHHVFYIQKWHDARSLTAMNKIKSYLDTRLFLVVTFQDVERIPAGNCEKY